MNFPFRKPKVPASLESFFNSARSRPFILHRSQLLRFIESKPAERYKVVSDLIGLDQLEQIEKNWKDLRDNAEWSLNAAQEQYRRTLSALVDLLKPTSDQSLLLPLTALPKTDHDVINAAQQRLAKYALPQIQCWEDVQTVRQAVLERSRSPEDIARAEQLRILQRKCTQVQSDLEQAGQFYIKLAEARENFISKMECLDDAIFETLLQEGRRLLAENDLEECPLCEREFTDQRQLLGRVEARLHKLEALTLSKRVLQGHRGKAIEIGNCLATRFEALRR